MLGFYESFPKNVHKVVCFRALASKMRMQRALTQTLHELNNETFSLEDIASPSVPQCTVILEFGIADEVNFNYLDEEETKRILKIIHKKTFKIMDFFCAIRYHKTQNRKKTPLKFDYYMLRFTFNKKSTEIQVFHERGPRHVSPEEIVNFVINKTNEKFSRKILKAITAS
ncbi:MAG: hypothetical protein NWE85_01885 [Candidatus Bathyarchaeota archaeon]|nr:hypothetical protein [Candidatus Bathyarchaeota archaeon]